MWRAAVVPCLILSLAAPAVAQSWTASQQPVALELARALGEAHGVSKRCVAGDQTWRTKMRGILDRETEDSPFHIPLRDAFNSAYQASQDAFSGCSAEAKKAGAAAEVRASDRLKRLGEPS